MSDHSRIAIVQASIDQALATPVLGRCLTILLNEYQFGFRGRGNVLRLVYDGEKYKWQDTISETFLSAHDISAEVIQQLVERYRSFAITGSVRIPGKDRLYDLAVALCPTFDPERPASLVVLLEPSLYHDVYGEDDEFDQDAANTLFRVAVRLGADDDVEGFQMVLITSLADIKAFTGLTLRQSLLKPMPTQEAKKGVGLPHGLITGIKASLMPLAEIGAIWTDGSKFEVVAGFSVLNDLVEIDETSSDED